MLKTNVIFKNYRVTMRTLTGGVAVQSVSAESESAARLKITCPDGWEIVEVEEL